MASVIVLERRFAGSIAEYRSGELNTSFVDVVHAQLYRTQHEIDRARVNCVYRVMPGASTIPALSLQRSRSASVFLLTSTVSATSMPRWKLCERARFCPAARTEQHTPTKYYCQRRSGYHRRHLQPCHRMPSDYQEYRSSSLFEFKSPVQKKNL